MSFLTFVRVDNAGGMDGYGSISAVGVHTVFAKSHDRSGGVANLTVQNGILTTGFGGFSTFTGATTSTGTSSAPYTLGSWVHLAYVIETNSVKTYINGNLVATTTGTVDFATLNSQDLWLGKYSDYWYPLNGALDDFRVYTRALSAAEVLSISQSSGTAASPISAITPDSARLDVLQQFTITGTGLTAGMGFTVENCEPSNQEVPGTGSATSRTFQCTPRLPGPKNVTVKTAPGGTVLFTSAAPASAAAVPITVDHPARLGDPAARGIPAVDAVSLWNGNVHLSATDLSVPGKGVSFALTRSYNSYDSGDTTQPTYEARHGSVSNAAPWRFNWDIQTSYVAGTGNSQLSVQREDGSGESYFKDTDGIWYPTDQGNFNTFKGDTPIAGQSTLLTREGIKYIFQNPDLGGKLIGIFDHDGNGLTVARDGSNRVSTVTDASGRVYTFSYDASSRLVRVTDFSGRQVNYTWETSTSPVGTYLKTVTDVRGGVTTYNYTNQNPASITAPNKPTLQRLLTSVQDARLNTARTFSYTGNAYGNWGAASVTDAMGATWGFGYCAKQPDGSCTTVPNTAQGFETTMTPPLGAATVTRFDTGGRPTANQHVGNNSTLTRTTPLTVAGGLTPRTYNQASLPTKKESALGVAGGYFTALEYTADKQGDLWKRTDALGATTARTWLTGAGATAAALVAKNLRRVETLTTATPGATHTFTHNNSGKVLTYTPPGLPATTLSYDPANGQLTSVRDARNNTSSRTYDAHGNLKTVTDPEGTVAYNYDSLGRVLTTTDKRGAVTTQTWDSDGNLLTVKDALNPIPVSYVYDANGNRTQMTDARGNITHYSYDKNNRLATVSRVLGAQTLTTTSIYDALGRVTSIINANNHANSTTFDASGNVLTRVNALADTTQYTYDADNRVISTTDPVGRVTTTSYDRVGRILSTTTGFGTAAAATTSYAYDGDGRMISRTDPRGKLTQYGYDLAGRMTSVTDANNAITRSTFDANGNALTISDPAGKTTSYTYDALNRPLTRTDSNGQQWVTTYDLNGNVKTVTVPGNKTTTYTYDLLNRVSRIDYPDASFVSYTYDPNGNRLTMVDSTGTTSYTYDALNRLSSKTDPQGKTVAYNYDGVGNVATLGYPGGQSVSYSYDAGERLVSLTDWLNKTTVYTLNRAGQVTTALLGNGTRAEMAYDGAGRLGSLVNKKPDNSVISSHQLTLDANGNITNAAVTLPLQPALVSATRYLNYDNANRLAMSNFSSVSGDSAGRITSLGDDTFSYNDRDQITTIAGSQSASYAYNGDGHRVQRTINGVTTRSVFDANRGLPEVLAETDNAGNVQQRYVYGYGLVEQVDSTNAAHYYHFDPTGSTLALTNGAGAVTDSYAYTPYGETTSSGSTVNPFRYVGKLGVMDDGNGLQYMRARYYRPEVARFMSLDALAGAVNNPQSLNRYAYVLGNPVMGADPSGFEREGYSMYSGYTMTDKGPTGPVVNQSPNGIPWSPKMGTYNGHLYDYSSEIKLATDLISLKVVWKAGKYVISEIAGEALNHGLNAHQVLDECKGGKSACFEVVVSKAGDYGGGAIGTAICVSTGVGTAIVAWCAYTGGKVGEIVGKKVAFVIEAIPDEIRRLKQGVTEQAQTYNNWNSWFVTDPVGSVNTLLNQFK